MLKLLLIKLKYYTKWVIIKYNVNLLLVSDWMFAEYRYSNLRKLNITQLILIIISKM